MNEMDRLRFNYTTMPHRKEYCMKKHGDAIIRMANVKNDYGWHDFVFAYGYYYNKKREHAIFVSFIDGDNRVHKSNVFPDHPDFDFLEAYITEI